MKRVITLFLFPLVVSAAPGPVTQYLINEPATMLDVGMVRLDHLTTLFKNAVGLSWTVDGKPQFFRVDINSRYEPEDDKIYVSVSTMSETATEAQMEEGCRNALGQLRIWLRKSLPEIFRHVGHEDPAEPDDLPQALLQMFELRCYVSGDSSADGRFWARWPLADKHMTIVRWPIRN